MIGTQIQKFSIAIMFSLAVATAWAGKATVTDSAGVLGTGTPGIEAAAADAPFDVIVTTYNSMASKGALDAAVDAAVKATPGNVVGIGVDTNLRRVHIASNGVRLTQAQVDAAQRAAGGKFQGSDWAGGMVAAISDLSGAAPAAGAAPAGNRSTANSAPVPANQRAESPASDTRANEPREGGGFPWMWIILGVIAFFIFRKFMANRNRANQGYDPSRAGMQNPNTPPPPPGGYNQNQEQPGGGGMMRGGLLGGLGGGLMGYMLGRNAGAAGEQNPQDQVGSTGYDSGNQGDGGFISGGDSGDFGGGGGDFGGGDSGDF